MTFKGAAVKFYVTRSTGVGTARVYLDGVLKKTAILTSSTTQYRQLAYAVSRLTTARHTVKVVCVGTSSGSASGVGVDYLLVT